MGVPLFSLVCVHAENPTRAVWSCTCSETHCGGSKFKNRVASTTEVNFLCSSLLLFAASHKSNAVTANDVLNRQQVSILRHCKYSKTHHAARCARITQLFGTVGLKL